MNRYSTITFEIETDFDAESMADVWVTFEQGKTRITKKKSLGQLTAKDKSIFPTLSQTETALFTAFMPIGVQARWINSAGVTDSSTVEFFSLGDVMEEGEMYV